jgi:hypothetical protein
VQTLADLTTSTEAAKQVSQPRPEAVMANTVLLLVTIDHQVIMSWAQRRRARPATFAGDEHPWPLGFDLGAAGAGLDEISWDKFFAEFDRADLAFVYRDAGPNGQLDDLHEFVSRATVPELAISGKSTIARRVI